MASNKIGILDTAVYFYLLDKFYNVVSFNITGPLKEELAIEFDRKPATFNNVTGSLLDAKLLLRYKHYKRTYTFNPDYVFRGSNAERNKRVEERYTELLRQQKLKNANRVLNLDEHPDIKMIVNPDDVATPSNTINLDKTTE